MGAGSRDKPATERQRRILQAISDFTIRARLPAVGAGDRRAGRALVLFDDSRPPEGARKARAHFARSYQAARPALRVRRWFAGQPDAVVMPILGKVAAGVPITAAENVEGEFAAAGGFVPRASDAFMLRVQGDSMIEAAILDGDLIVVRPQRTADNGEVVVAMLERRSDGEALLSRTRTGSGFSRRIAAWRQSTRAMSRSSDASRLSSAASKLAFGSSARRARVMRRVGELPFVAAVREALPWSFIGLLAAFVVVFVAQFRAPAFAGPSLGLRLARRPAARVRRHGRYADRAAGVARCARKAGYPPAATAAGQRAAFAAGAAAAVWARPVAYLRTLGASGLFIAILACGVDRSVDDAVARGARGPTAHRWIGAALAIAIFAALSAAHVSLAGVDRRGDAADLAARRYATSR